MSALRPLRSTARAAPSVPRITAAHGQLGACRLFEGAGDGEGGDAVVVVAEDRLEDPLRAVAEGRRRALQLASEFPLDYFICDLGNEAFRVVPELRQARARVFCPLTFKAPGSSLFSQQGRAEREKAEKEVYSYSNKEDWHGRIEYRLATDEPARLAQQTALAAWRGLGCRDGGRIDLRSDASGIPCFMEVNPLAGLRPDHSDLPILCELTGMPYQKLIDGIMRSALTRIRKAS